MKNPQKINLTSSNLTEEKLAELYRILPEAFAENKVDFDKLRAVLGDSVQVGPEKFSFSWAGKSNAIKNVLVPSHLTLNPEPKQSIKWDETENLFIEGDNLEVLKLLQKAYFEKVKMIYIDPPYNTGHDFVYNDDFSSPLDNYLKQTGQKSEDGNSNTTNKETNGRYHSDWLSMMYPRLKLAWNLLREDGVIFVSIDDNEVHHLRMIMDEVFGDENFISEFSWRRTDNQPNVGSVARVKEYIVVYAKSTQNFKFNKMSLTDRAKKEYRYQDEKGNFRRSNLLDKTRGRHFYDVSTPNGKVINGPWMLPESEFKKISNDGAIYWASGEEEIPYGKVYLHESDGQIPSDFLGIEFGTNQEATIELQQVFDDKVFDFPKPVSLLRHLINIGSTGDDLVLDFFAGSGTTAHAVLKQNQEDENNRKFILVQLPEKLEKPTKEFSTISDIAKERIRRVIKGYGNEPQPINTGFKVFTLSESNYPENNFVLDVEKSQEENQKAFIDYLNKAKQNQLFDKENDTSLVYENIVKEGLSLNSKVEKISIGKNNVYKVIDGEQQLLICLENKLASETVKELTDKSQKGKIFICLESSLDDTTAANLSLNLDLKTI